MNRTVSWSFDDVRITEVNLVPDVGSQLLT
jgi:hypothetical protein